jgi:membrane fusion protein, multidrug efflux system
MKKRQIIISGLFLLLIPAAILITRAMQGGGESDGPAKAGTSTSLRKVRVLPVQLGDHTLKSHLTGRVMARNRAGIYADVPGRMLPTKKDFREGVYFSRGEEMIRLDNRTEREALKARRMQLYNRVAGMIPDLRMTYPSEAEKWENYLGSISADKTIPELPQVNSEQEKLFISARDILNQYYTIKSEEERMTKFVLRAPFYGQLTQAAVLPGSYVQPGQKLGELTGLENFEMETSLPLSELSRLKPGQAVQLTDPSSGTKYEGRLLRVLQAVDEQTQNGRIILSVKGKGLYHGQFLEGTIQSQHLSGVARVRRTLITEEASVFLVKENKLVLAPVETVAVESEYAYVKGLSSNDLLLDESSPSFQEGMEVQYEQQ